MRWIALFFTRLFKTRRKVVVRIKYGISLLTLSVVAFSTPILSPASEGKAAGTPISLNSMASPAHTTQLLPSLLIKNRRNHFQRQLPSLASNSLKNIPAQISTRQSPIQPSTLASKHLGKPQAQVPSPTTNNQAPSQSVPSSQTSNSPVQPSSPADNNQGRSLAQPSSPANNSQAQPAQLGNGQDTSVDISGPFSAMISWGDDSAAAATTTDASMTRNLSATFTLGDAQGSQPSDYHMMINWGDGTTTEESIGKKLVNKSVHVTGSHIYHKAGTYVIALTIHDNNGNQVTATRTVVV